MDKNPPTHPDRHELALPLAVKLLLCLWMTAVVFVYFVLFFPAEYLYISAQMDLRGWLLALREWIQPFFTEV